MATKDADVNKRVNVIKIYTTGILAWMIIQQLRLEYFPVYISDESVPYQSASYNGKDASDIRAHLTYEKHPLAGRCKVWRQTCNKRYFKRKVWHKTRCCMLMNLLYQSYKQQYEY